MNKICIGVPCAGTIKAKTAFSLVRTAIHSNYEIDIILRTSCDLVGNRNWIVNEARRRNFTHLFFVDSDISFGDQTLNQLMAHNKEIVGASYNRRRFPLESTVKFLDEKGYPTHEKKEMPNELFNCAGMGLGAVLIKLSVFDKISQPWFQFEYDNEGKQINGEDIFFFIKALNAGIPVWCDPTIPIIHTGEFDY